MDDHERALELDRLGQLEQASVHYRKALKRHHGDPRKSLSILFHYLDNLILRGLLPFAEKLARRARALTVSLGEAETAPEGWLYPWYVRSLQGLGAIDVDVVFPQLPAGPGLVMVTDIRLRQHRALEALRRAGHGFRSAKVPALIAAAEIQLAQAVRMVNRLVDDKDTAELHGLVVWSREHGAQSLLVQALLVSARQTPDPATRVARLQEALVLAHSYRLRLLEIDIELEMPRSDADDLLRRSRRLGYGWGEYEAHKRLGKPPPSLEQRLFGAFGQKAEAGLEEHWPVPLGMPEFPLSCTPLPFVASVEWGPGLPPLVLAGGVLMQKLSEYPLALETAAAQYRRHVDRTNLYHLVAVALAGGPTPLVRRYVEDLDGLIEPLLLECLRIVAEPTLPRIEQIRELLRTPVHRHLRSVAYWQIGAVLEASGDVNSAIEAFEQCRLPWVASHLEKLDPSKRTIDTIELRPPVGAGQQELVIRTLEQLWLYR